MWDVAAPVEPTPTVNPGAAAVYAAKLAHWLELYGGEVKVFDAVHTTNECGFLVELLNNENLAYALAASERATEIDCP
jgi:hypothetical protein